MKSEETNDPSQRDRVFLQLLLHQPSLAWWSQELWGLQAEEFTVDFWATRNQLLQSSVRCELSSAPPTSLNFRLNFSLKLTYEKHF